MKYIISGGSMDGWVSTTSCNEIVSPEVMN